MANDYTYSELMQMQDKAIERVREMQERARRTMEADPVLPIKEEQKREEKPEEVPKVKAEPVKAVPKNQNQRSGMPFGLNLNLDKDRATVLPLLLLLMNEGADNLLLLALTYIMA